MPAGHAPRSAPKLHSEDPLLSMNHFSSVLAVVFRDGVLLPTATSSFVLFDRGGRHGVVRQGHGEEGKLRLLCSRWSGTTWQRDGTTGSKMTTKGCCGKRRDM
ncbi:tRNA lysidin [Sesbania bispinosa]|nr:tRNA lysidin [Sesbania bispinosa]